MRTNWCLTGSLTMNSSLTVYGVCKHLSVDHPVRHVEDVSSQPPCWLLVRVEDGLPSDTEAHQHHEHDDHEVQHVDHLQSTGPEILIVNSQVFMTTDIYLTQNFFYKFRMFHFIKIPQRNSRKKNIKS